MELFLDFMVRNWAMMAALMFVLILIVGNELHFLRYKGKEISPQVTVNLMNHQDAVVIDLRDREKFRKGHILHAIHAEAKDFTDKTLDHYKNTSIILVCERGVQSSSLAIKLRQYGFKKPFVLGGGMVSWEDAQFPIVKGK